MILDCEHCNIQVHITRERGEKPVRPEGKFFLCYFCWQKYISGKLDFDAYGDWVFTEREEMK